MNHKELKSLITDQFTLEREMYDFILDCLKKIYGENYELAKQEFESSYESFDYHMSLSFTCVEREINKTLAYRKANAVTQA